MVDHQILFLATSFSNENFLLGFGDMVPMQQNNALSENFSYDCFTIFFILTGLITLASSINLLVLRLAEDEAEEQIQERIEQEEAIKQIVHLDGDIISFHGMDPSSKEGPEEVISIAKLLRFFIVRQGSIQVILFEAGWVFEFILEAIYWTRQFIG